MSNRSESWRPTIPPKTNALTATAQPDGASAALKGASQAFASRATAQKSGTQAINNARAAAAVAGRIPGSSTGLGNGTSVQNGQSRGRQPSNLSRFNSDGALSVDSRFSSTSVSPLRQISSRDDSASGIAARVASANTSPSRQPAQSSSSVPNLNQIPYLTPTPARKARPTPTRRVTADSADARAARITQKPTGIDLRGIDEDDDASAALDSLVKLAKPTTSAKPAAVPTQAEPVYAETLTKPDLKMSEPIPIKPLPRGRVPSRMVVDSEPSKTRDQRTGLTESNLADAIVASSLASSRASSPSKPDLPPLLRTTSRSYSLLPTRPHQVEPLQRSNTGRTLKETLRKSAHQDAKDEDDEVIRRGRRHFVRKHVHKHHEGDRKRWRDKITERERKRYEGVWAANRGLLMYTSPTFSDGTTVIKPPPEEANLVVNVVVRDIWERSRLTAESLEEIWDLVAMTEGAKSLTREEFVVGMWLIDQRLKGRKLPIKVSTSVWNSVRYTQGVKISRKPL